MKKVNTAEMRAVEGGIAWWVAAAAFYVGANAGISMRIGYEHAKYGRCITYKKHCKKCK